MCYVFRKGNMAHRSSGHDSTRHLLGLEQLGTSQTLSKILLV